LRGQLILCLIISVLAYIGLTIFGIKYALVLALWAGLTEFIPYLGPFLGAIPAVFIALTTGSFMKGLLVVIIVMLIGAKLAGFIGLLLAVPFALILKVFLEDFFALKEEEESQLEA